MTGYFSDDAGFEARCHQHAELFALCLKLLAVITVQYQSFLYRLPFQPAGNLADRNPGTGPVESGPDIYCIGQGLGVFQAGIVDTVEEVLQCTAHVTEILGGAEYDCIGPEHIV